MSTEYLAGHNNTTGHRRQDTHICHTLCGRLADVAWEAIDHVAHPWLGLVAYPPVQFVRVRAMRSTLVMAPTA